MGTHECSSTENYQLYVPESAQVGKPVGKIKANDEDLGINADIKYSIINSEGANMFSISTDRDTREGIISLKKVRTCFVQGRLLRKIYEEMAMCIGLSLGLKGVLWRVLTTSGAVKQYFKEQVLVLVA